MTVAGDNGQRGCTRKASPGVWRESCAFRLKWCKRVCPRAVMRRFDSVCVYFSQAQADTAHNPKRDLLSVAAVNDLNCSVRTCLSFVDRSLRSLRANNQPNQSARHSRVKSTGGGCVPVNSS